MSETSKVVKFGYLQYHARAMLTLAIKHGDLIPATHCEQCGQSSAIAKIHGHHADYSRPFEIIWLCSSCHRTIHAPDRTRVIKKRSPKLQKALDWLKLNPDCVNKPSIWLEEQLGMSNGTIIKAQRILRGQADIMFDTDGVVIHHSWEPQSDRKGGRPRKKAS